MSFVEACYDCAIVGYTCDLAGNTWNSTDGWIPVSSVSTPSRSLEVHCADTMDLDIQVKVFCSLLEFVSIGI